jgi:hypothetical protein
MNEILSAFTSQTANYHTCFGAYNLHTLSMLLNSFYADCLIRHGFSWSLGPGHNVVGVMYVGGSKA